MTDKGLITGEDGLSRCWWCYDDPLYVRYHDEEWGRPAYDNVRLYEKLCLEGFQAGLSWLTILRKRENFRAAFDGFDFRKVAKYNENDIARLLNDAGIIRHRGKIEATINNAQRALEMLETYESLYDYFKMYAHTSSAPRTSVDIPSATDASKALSGDLKKRGWRFVGPTTCYAFMQAMGLVNDHLAGCHCRKEKG